MRRRETGSRGNSARFRARLDDCSDGDVLLDLFNLDGRFISGLRFRNEPYVTAANLRDTAVLVVNCLNNHVPIFTLLYRGIGGLRS